MTMYTVYYQTELLAVQTYSLVTVGSQTFSHLPVSFSPAGWLLETEEIPDVNSPINKRYENTISNSHTHTHTHTHTLTL